MSRYVHGDRSALHKAGLARREDAECLYRGQRYGGAMYLAGYAVECALKAALMEVADVDNLRDLEGWLEERTGRDPAKLLHSIEVLSALHPGVQRALQAPNDPLARDRVRARNECNRYWSTSLRYRSKDPDQETARRLLEAVDTYCKLIRTSR